MHIQAHKQQRKGFSSFYSWSYIIKGVVEIRRVGVVVVMLIFPCLSRGCLWVWFCVCAMYFLCTYILFILWIAVSKNVTCHTVLLATKINNICSMKQSNHWGRECWHEILQKLIFYWEGKMAWHCHACAKNTLHKCRIKPTDTPCSNMEIQA